MAGILTLGEGSSLSHVQLLARNLGIPNVVVGREFADAARAMHEGRAAEDLIHGQASPEEAQSLRDDGIAAMPLLVPIVPPDAAN